MITIVTPLSPITTDTPVTARTTVTASDLQRR